MSSQLAPQTLLEIALSTGGASSLEESLRGLLAALGRELGLTAAAFWSGDEPGGRRLVERWGRDPAPREPRNLPSRVTSQLLRLSDECELACSMQPEGVLWLRTRTRQQATALAADAGLGRVLLQVGAGLRQTAAFAATLRRADDHAAAERLLRATAGRLSTLVENLDGAILVESEDRRVVLANRAFCELFQVPAPPESMIGADCTRAAEGSKALFRDPEGFLAGVKRALAERRPAIAEPLEFADGRFVERDYVPIFIDGRYDGHLWLYRDVTARVRGERETERVRRFYEQVLDAMPVQLAVFDAAGRYEHVTPSAIANAETRAWIVGKSDIEYGARRNLPPEVAEQRRRTILEVASSGRERTFEESFRDRDGRWRHFVRYVHPVIGPDGVATHVLGYGIDVTERKQAEVELLEAKAAAERSARAKEVFLANMSHEMRTPLNAVVGMSHLLSETRLDPTQGRYVQAVRFSADTLLALINDILDFSKIEAGRIEFESVPFRLRPVLSGLMDAVRLEADRKGLALRLDLAPDVPEVLRGDVQRLKQILLNLLSNAVKFTEHGFVSLGLFRHADPSRALIGFRIADTGIGIPEDKRAVIFDAFTQATPETQRRFGGTGLGLAITRQLVERQGGRIEVESHAGGGSCFTVHLPFEVADPAEVPGPTAAPISLAGLRVLLAEDNAINQMVAATLLRRAGATVEIAPDGQEALERVAKERFDVVLMDLQMPRMDGVEAARRIRQDLGMDSETLPILALTASALLEERDRALAVGMDDFVIKPFQPADLFERVARQAARRRPALAAEPASPRPAASPGLAVGIDESILAGSSLGEPEFAVQLIDAFIAETEPGARAIERAGREGDAKRIRALAHSLKAAAGTLGAMQLRRYLVEMEELATVDCAPDALAYAAAQAAIACDEAVAAFRPLRERYARQAGLPSEAGLGTAPTATP